MIFGRSCLSIGLNAGFLFGNITHSRNLIFPSSTGADNVYRNQRYEIRDLKLDFGIQYTHPLSKTEHVTVGFVYSPGKKLNTTVYDIRLLALCLLHLDIRGMIRLRLSVCMP